MKAIRRFMVWAASTCAMTTLMVAPWSPKPSLAAAPDFPITELRWWNWLPNDPWQSIQFTVPDQDTTISAYGGALRRYDIHIAKMFEVTHYLCQRNIARRTLKGFDWHYEAANGNVDMGRFKITCKLAREIVTAYGLSHTEQTEINLPFDENGQFVTENDRSVIRLEQNAIPVLNITDSKTLTWMNYVQAFRPLVDHWEKILVENSFPVDEVLSGIRNKTEVPILLPSNVLDLPSKLHYEIRSVNANGYSLCRKVATPCSKRPLMAGFDRFEAYRDGAFSRPSGLPKDTFRKIQLANGIEGIFNVGCGSYCISSLEWKFQGVLYRLSGKGGQQQWWVQVANSAIAAGPR